MDPRILLLLVVLGFPLLEFYVLLEVGRAIGSISTIFVVVFTGVLGLLLMRHQGTYNLSRMRKCMDRGEIPAIAMFESVFIFVAAVLMLIPGFITDAIGLILLITPLRRLMVRRMMGLPRFTPPPAGQGGHQTGTSQNASQVIEGECKREDD